MDDSCIWNPKSEVFNWTSAIAYLGFRIPDAGIVQSEISDFHGINTTFPVVSLAAMA
jgi:hypothetical protein